MTAKISPLTTRWHGLKSAILTVFGIHELLFLAGFGAFFVGLSRLWSLWGALAVCGAILMLVSLISIIFAERTGGYKWDS